MEFDEVPFTELLSKIVDNRGRTCPTAEIGLPLIATNCVRNDLLYPAFEKVRYVSKETHENWFRGHPIPGDLIFVCKGTPGRVCMTPDPVSFCIAQDMVAVRADSKKVYPKYLFALLRSPQVQAKIGNMHVGTLIPHFKKGDFDKLLLPVPDKKTQETIGDTYFELTAKIELNRRMNATLEAMARALFQSWFVDFDPVRAKLDGRPPAGLDPATAALFPASFHDSPLGHIPTGWEAIPLYDTAQWVNGAAFRNEDFCVAGEGLPVIKIGELKAGISDQTKWCRRDAAPDKIIDTGDLVYSWSGSPDTSLEAFLWSGGRGMLNQHIFKVISPTAAEKRFVYYLLQYLRPVLVETARNKQTTGLGHVTIADMKRLLVCMPNKAVLAAFDRNVAPIFDKAFTNTLESRTLATLRDTLLPKLLSGELSVAGVERSVEAVL
jgi:type I restriction enzyme S subunit